MAVTFFIEPWQVEETSDALTLREEVTVRDFVLGGVVSLGISLLVGALDLWLWRRGTIGGVIAAWLGFASAVLAAKGFEQFGRGWRLGSHGPRCLTFRGDENTVELEGFRGPANGRAERIVIATIVWPRTSDAAESKQHTVLLFVDGQRMELGTYGAEAAADRLAETITRWVGIRTSRLSE